MVLILDYGVGNLTSIKNMLKKCGAEAIISSDPVEIAGAAKLILPGVGAFDHGMLNLRSASFFSILQQKVLQQNTPILGVCLGAQLLAESSEEGEQQGLGWIAGRVVKFDAEKMNPAHLKVPHMGWTDVTIKKDIPLFKGLHEDARFYFVHSYHWQCTHAENVTVTADYGYDFTAGVEKDNILGVQFHPEKSHKYGMMLFDNFIKYY